MAGWFQLQDIFYLNVNHNYFIKSDSRGETRKYCVSAKARPRQTQWECVCVYVCTFVSLRKTPGAILRDKVCVCLTNIRQRDAERWPAPGWDQVSAASSRDDRRIECSPLSISITHHLLHPHVPSSSSPSLSLLFFCSIHLFPTIFLFFSLLLLLASLFVCHIFNFSSNLSHFHSYFHSSSASVLVVLFLKKRDAPSYEVDQS